MNMAHWHLALNHIPVVGCAFAAALLAYALARGSEELKRTALGMLVAVSLLAVPAYFTGEPAEEMIEHEAGVAEARIESHEEAATAALAALSAAGLAALALLLASRKTDLPKWGPPAVLLLALAAAGLMGRAANLGGQVRHPETQAGFAPAAEAEHEEVKE